MKRNAPQLSFGEVAGAVDYSEVASAARGIGNFALEQSGNVWITTILESTTGVNHRVDLTLNCNGYREYFARHEKAPSHQHVVTATDWEPERVTERHDDCRTPEFQIRFVTTPVS